MRRSEILLGTLLVAIIAVIGITALLLWFRPALSRVSELGSSPTVAADAGNDNGIAGNGVVLEQNTAAYTAQMGYAVAQRRVLGWQNDAALLSSSATWAPGSTLQEILSGQVAWGFTFYSPASNLVAIVSVADNAAAFVNQQPASATLTPLPVSGWRIDSDDVIQALFDNGGREFLQREGDSTLTITLTYNPTASRVEWFVSLIAQRSGHSLTMLVNAADGAILELDEIP